MLGLSTVVGVLVTSLGYLLVREFNRKDKIGDEVRELAARVTVSIEALNKAVSSLTLAVEEIRMWSHDRFITRSEHRDANEALKADVAANAARFERELDNCSKRCPARSDRAGLH